MQRKNKRWTHATLLAAGMAALISLSGIGNAAATGLSEAQQEKENLEQELKEAQEMIESLNDSKEDIEEAVKELDEKLQGISRQISELENQLKEKQEAVNDTEQELAAAEEDRRQQYEDMKLRIQFMYENQNTFALEKLLSAGSIADFLNEAEYISQISQYDRNMLLKYEETVESIAKMEEVLKQEISELEAMKQEVEKEQMAVAALVQEKESKLAQTEGKILDAQQLAAVYEAEIQAQDEAIAQIQAAEEERIRQEQEQAAQEAEQKEDQNSQENNGGGSANDSSDTPEDSGNNDGESSGGNGGQTATASFTWPCPSSTRITSDYGPRESPTAGASSYHKGIDIGAAYGADIVAAADGTVIFSGYSNSAGNYITIDHGKGLYTVYMHCSSLLVSKGASVSRGQVIAKVGSTGISTGNHLHFGVSLNGSYVNPWNYL